MLDDREDVLALGGDGVGADDTGAVVARDREAGEDFGEDSPEGRTGAIDVAERNGAAAPRAYRHRVESGAVGHGFPVISARSCSSAGRSKPCGERPPARKSGLMIAHASSQ